MKDYDGIILFIVGAVMAGLLFYGITVVVLKSFKPKKDDQPAFDSSQMISEQKHRAEDIRERQKELMRQNQQKIRDRQR